VSTDVVGSTVPGAEKPALGVGLYGKLPARGDFVQRHLPRDFIDAWDEWLQQALAESREQLGEQWLRSYLTSPVWRFALNRGLCGQSAVAGVMIPSVDRVGRYFPLTIAALLPHLPEPLLLAEQLSAWYDQVETLILEGLDDDLDFERFAARVGELPSPQDSVSKAEPIIPTQQDWYCPLPDLASLPQLRAKLLPLLLQRAFNNYSVWWTQGSEHIAPGLLVCKGLPATQGFAALLAGRWEHWDWWSAPAFGMGAKTDDPAEDPLGEL